MSGVFFVLFSLHRARTFLDKTTNLTRHSDTCRRKRLE
jgi:hypothetical protein